MDEKRKHMRLPLVMTADFKTTVGATYRGRTKNIGMGGLFVRFPDDKPLVENGDRCCVSLVLYERKKRMAIECKCKVVHQNSVGIGFKFHSIDFVYLDRLRKLLRISPNSAKLAENLKRQCA